MNLILQDMIHLFSANMKKLIGELIAFAGKILFNNKSNRIERTEVCECY